MSDILLCVTAGRGPAECRLAVEHVIAAMRDEAESAGLTFGEEAPDRKAGSVLLTIAGQGGEGFAQSWAGTIQWIARSGIRPGHKRKNWFIAVRRIDPPEREPEIAANELRFETMRAGGPGGQHQNRTESAIRLVHVPTGLSVVARDERSQHRNKALATERIRALLGAVHERNRDAARFRDWLAKIAVERGNPIRTYEGEEFRRRG
ncbi:MAG: peptide chain release factor H [Beijerinckiaceae bacterium]|nr:peptide chain release factor H [Beijerinckiaceae bacterium]